MQLQPLYCTFLAVLVLGDIAVALPAAPSAHRQRVVSSSSFLTVRSPSVLHAKRVSRTSSRSASATGAGPKAASARSPPRRERNTGTARTERRRAPHQFDHTQEEARPFVDPLTEVRNQSPNEDAAPVKLPASSKSKTKAGNVIEHAHFETRSLDDLFNLQFSQQFASSTSFRTELRQAMREDIFDRTPAYHGMSDKARTVLLLPDSSLQGSWKCRDGGWKRRPSADEEDAENSSTSSRAPRMERLTQVLQRHLGETAPTGDEFMDTIGSLCGSQPQTHWIDIVGVLNRRVPHSWHQDTGRSPNGDTYTVLLGFPADDHYDGVGVFSHILKLHQEQWAPEEHPPNEPVLYGALDDEIVDESQIVRPRFAEGREIIFYRDVDVLHSSPDVAYRGSVMRFM